MGRLVEGSYATRLPDGTWVLVPLTSLHRYMTQIEYRNLAGILVQAAQDTRRHQEAARTA
jgi:hypothetical protein